MSNVDYEFDQETRHAELDAINIQQFAPILVGDLDLTPLNISTRVLLRHVGSGFLNETAREFPEESCLVYAWIHSHPIDVATRAVYGPRVDFLATVMEWGKTISSDQVDELMDKILEHTGAKQKAATRSAKTRTERPKSGGQRRRSNT